MNGRSWRWRSGLFAVSMDASVDLGPSVRPIEIKSPVYLGYGGTVELSRYIECTLKSM